MDSHNYSGIIEAEVYKKQFSEVIQKFKNKKIILYGAGEFFNVIDNSYDLRRYFDIAGISDKKFENGKMNEYNGYKVILPSELRDYSADAILLTLVEPNKVLNALKLASYKYIKEIVPVYTNISPLFKYDINLLKYENGKMYYHLNEYDIDVVADEYYGIIEEVFYWKIYNIKDKFKFENYDLYDIGMNRAYTDIYFALDPRCRKIFGFEPFKATYNYALENISLNPKLKSKINAFPFGLSNKNVQEDVYFLPHRDGISTVNYDFIKSYAPEEIGKTKKEIVELRCADEVLGKLIEENPSAHRILKLDAEGAEYDVLPNLYNADLLKLFNVAVGDMHILKSKYETKSLFEYFYKSGFEVYEINEHEKTIDYILYKDIEIA